MSQENRVNRSRRLSIVSTGIVASLLVAGCTIQQLSGVAGNSAISKKNGNETLLDAKNLRSSRVTLDEVMARAVKLNLEQQIERVERSLQDYKKAGGLTEKVWSDSITSFYRSIPPHTPLETAWNHLDSIVDSRYGQTAGSQERDWSEIRQTIAGFLMQEARTQYWKGVAAQKGLEQIEVLLKKAENIAQAESNERDSSVENNPLETIRYLEKLRSSFQADLKNLTELIGLNEPGSLVLSELETEKMKTNKTLTLSQMEQMALFLRTELNSAGVEPTPISEARQALQTHLSNLELDSSPQLEQDHSVVSRKWELFGTRLSRLLDELTIQDGDQGQPFEIEKEQQERQKVISVAVLGQVHLAYTDLLLVQSRWQAHKKSFSIGEGIAKEPVLREAVSQIAGLTKRYNLQGQVHNALNRLQSSIGFIPFPEKNIKKLTVSQLTQMIQYNQQQWDNEQTTLAILSPSGPLNTPEMGAVDSEQEPSAIGMAELIQPISEDMIDLQQITGIGRVDRRLYGADQTDSVFQSSQEIKQEFEEIASQFGQQEIPIYSVKYSTHHQSVEQPVEPDEGTIVRKIREAMEPARYAKTAKQDKRPPLRQALETTKHAQPEKQPQAQLSLTGEKADQEPVSVGSVLPENREMSLFKNDLASMGSWRYAVQVAALYKNDSSENLVEELANKGYSPVIWESEDYSGKRFHRIWIGLYSDSAQAKLAQDYYKIHEKKPAFITPISWNKPS
ncbi:MAG: SPOR domain-containing protein [Magnetococcales bacterium]|nr:SPOR domain-containing protein [Magnetococcales bacterium]